MTSAELALGGPQFNIPFPEIDSSSFEGSFLNGTLGAEEDAFYLLDDLRFEMA